jgi:hypothetical protein
MSWISNISVNSFVDQYLYKQKELRIKYNNEDTFYSSHHLLFSFLSSLYFIFLQFCNAEIPCSRSS